MGGLLRQSIGAHDTIVAMDADQIQHGRRWALAVALLLTLIVYVPTLQSPYISDDYPLFSRPLYGLAELIRTHEGYMRPLPRLTMWAHYKLFGLDTTAAHIVQIALHATTAWLVGALALRLTGRFALAILAGALFALHPIHPTSVSWLSGRFDLMCAGFSIGCLLAHDSAKETGRFSMRLVALLLFVGALASKEQAFCVPLLVVLLDLVRRRRWAPLGAWPYVLVCCAYAAFRIHELGSIGGRYAGLSLTAERLQRGMLNSFAALVQPANSIYWGESIAVVRGFLWAGLVSLVVLGLARRRSDVRLVAFGLAFAVLSILPFVAYVAKGFGGGLVGARVLYLSTAGYCIALAGIVGRPLTAREPTAWAAGALVAVYAVVAFGNNLAWRAGGKVADRVTAGLAEMFPEFGVPHPILAVSGVPRTHMGTYVFLGTSLRHATHEHLAEPHRVVQLGQNVWKPFETLAWRKRPEEVFAARWNAKRQNFTNVTEIVRAELSKHLERSQDQRVWAGADLAEWRSTGTAELAIRGELLVGDGEGGLLELVGPLLDGEDGLVFELAFDGKPPPSCIVLFVEEGRRKPFANDHFLLSGHPRKQRHLVVVPKAPGGARVFAKLQVRPPDGTFSVHSIRATRR